MTVETTISKAGPYAGAGTVGPFPVPFRFLDATHLQVTRTDASGVNTVLALGSDYSVAGVGNLTGSVTLTSPLASGFKLTVLRNVPATQEADYVQNDAFPAESHEQALDKLTMLAQQQAERVGRSLVVPETDAPVSLTLPPASSRARRYLSFDADGRPMSTTFDVDAVQEASQAAQDAAAAASVSENNAAKGAENAAASAEFARDQSDFVKNQVAATTPTVVRFSGDGVETTFPLPSVPGAEENTLVYISGAYQQKNTYDIPAGTSSLVFSEAPPVGTENIEVVIAPSVMLSISDAQDMSFVGPDGIKRNVGYYLRDAVSRVSIPFPDYVAASAAAATLPDGQIVEVTTEKKQFTVIDGALTNARSTDQLRIDLASSAPGAGANLVASPVADPSQTPMTVAQRILEQPVSVSEFSHLVEHVTAKEPGNPSSHLFTEFDSWANAIQAAINYASANKRRRVRIPLKDGRKYLLDKYINVPLGVELEFEDFITLADYTTIGGILVIQGSGVVLQNPMVDGSGIFAGGTGENGIAVISGEHIRSYGGVVTGCARGNEGGRFGGKAIQVEHSDAKDVKFSGMLLKDSFAALSSVRDALHGDRVDVEFSDFTAINCGSLLLAKMTNSSDFTGRQHVVRVHDFVAQNVGNGGAVIQYSRASRVAVLDGDIVNTSAYGQAPLIAGSHLYCDHRVSYTGSADDLILVDSINDYTVDMSYPSINNNYDIAATGTFKRLVGGANALSVVTGGTGSFKLNDDVQEGFFGYAARNGAATFDVKNDSRNVTVNPNLNFIGSSNPIKLSQFPAGRTTFSQNVGSLTWPSAPGSKTTISDYRENVSAGVITDASGAGLSFPTNYFDYVKVGRLVQVSFRIEVGANSSSGAALLGGLPFAAASGNRATSGFSPGYTNLGYGVGVGVTPGGTTFQFIKTNGTLVTNTELAGKMISGVITYLSD